MVDKEQIGEVLAKLVPREKISGIVINAGHIGFALEAADENLRKACEKEVFKLPGVEKVTAVLTGDKARTQVENKNTPMLDKRHPLPGVKKIIMVASGKGGVGKSTVAVNLAVASAVSGLRVGLVDADIYGPSIPRMLGLQKSGGENVKPEIVDHKMIPFKAYGILANSVGFLLAENDAAIWRGPMAGKALHQLLLGTAWDVDGGLDHLFIDMPPGTGDIALSLAQNYKIDGAVLVSTPQEIALIDVKRAVKMFERTNIPILGLVQNMSFFEAAGAREYIFGKDGARNFAEQNNIQFLGDVPLFSKLRENSDNGKVELIEEFAQIVKKLAL